MFWIVCALASQLFDVPIRDFPTAVRFKNMTVNWASVQPLVLRVEADGDIRDIQGRDLSFETFRGLLRHPPNDRMPIYVEIANIRSMPAGALGKFMYLLLFNVSAKHSVTIFIPLQK